MVIKVLVEISHKKLDKTFNYLVKDNLINKIKVGVRVLVPFSKMTLEGFVLEINSSNDYAGELLEIIDVLDDSVVLNEELLELGKYISKKTISTLISSYQVMLPRALKARKKNNIKIKEEYYVYPNKEFNNLKLSEKQQVIMDVFLSKKKELYSELKKINSAVDTLIKKNILIKKKEEVYRLNDDDDHIFERKELTSDQLRVSTEVISNLGKYEKYLLHGITGSGKTEVYMDIIDKVIATGKEALVLVPEISLTPQTVKRFKRHFYEKIAILHSGLSDGEKYDEYRKIVKGEVAIVIGARSAIFAPLKNLGVIIIDECHSPSYKQENMPRYDALDIANYRGSYHQCPVVFGSATPTIDLYARTLKGYYHLLELKNRIGNSQLPNIIIADMNKEKRVEKTNFSESLYNKIKEKLHNNEQVILLLNRRGYANYMTCKNCGYVVKCPNCDISLTYHKSSDMLRCHYCGYATNKLNICPNCHSKELSVLGTGTEKIEEEIKLLFKDYKLVRMDFDTTSKKGSHEQIINDFGEGKYQILLGTQMIAKGLDFPNVTLVGVINADTSLSIPSYRSSENTYELLCQVSGRSGRSEKVGDVVIQTFNPDHYAIKCVYHNNYLAFYKEEMRLRLLNKYPPYYYLLNILVKGADYKEISSEANKIISILNNELKDENTLVLGPTVAVPFKINNIYRFSILIKYKQDDKLYSVLNNINDHYRNNEKINLEFAFNPENI